MGANIKQQGGMTAGCRVEQVINPGLKRKTARFIAFQL